MTDELWNELRQCMNRYCITPIPQDRYEDNMFFEVPYDVDPYSPYYEPMIKQAVQYKREGNYDDAIKCYIDIFKREKRFNTEIVRYLCKVLICDGELVLAFRFLCSAWYELSTKCGQHLLPSIPAIPWAQLFDATELMGACSCLVNTTDFHTFYIYVTAIANDPSYLMPKYAIPKLLMQAGMIAAKVRNVRLG